MPFKRPESVLVVIYTGHGEVLRLRRREPPDFWQSAERRDSAPGGSARGARETGLLADAGLADSGTVNRYPIHPAWRAKFAPEVKENTEYVFSLRLPAIDAVRINPDEHLEYRWLPRDEAAELAGSGTDRHAILKLVPEKS